MVSFARCQHILADHPKVHPQSLAAKEYKKLGFASLPFLEWNPSPDGDRMWDYQKQDQLRYPDPITAPNSPTIRVRVDKDLAPTIVVHAPDSPTIAGLQGGTTVSPRSTEIAAQIKALGLQGLNALLYIFHAKHGSLEAAFEHMDANGSRRVSLNDWSTNLLVMTNGRNVSELEQLVGLSPREMFARMDVDDSSTISRDEFLTFFQRLQRQGIKGKGKGKGDARRKSNPAVAPDTRRKSNPAVQRSAATEDRKLKAIEDEEALLLAALGSLEEKLDGGPAKPAGAANVAPGRRGRPPRPKPLKLN
jgi:hypothetical protein